MLSKNEIKDIQSLAQKKFRDERQLFTDEGPKIVGELLQLAPQQVQQLYATAEWAALHGQGLQPRVISEGDLARISQLQTPNGVLAVLRQWPQQAPVVRGGWHLYLDAIQDPGNLGTIIRIADWFAVKSVVCSAGCADVYNSKVIQSSMASIARIPVYYDRGGAWLHGQQAPVYAATLGGRPLPSFRPTDTGILVIGNESKGVRPEIVQLATNQVTIPRKGGAESLNAAVATGILLAQLVS